MSVSETRLDRTLERIGYDGSRDVSYETLRSLQQGFLLSVPFENLDIHAGRHIDITADAVYRKVVERRRGGFCYELNSLFHDLLSQVGFKVSFLAATMMRDGRPGTPMGHLVLGVQLDGQNWLTDVGNGKSTREPLRFDGSNETWAEAVGYRVCQTPDGPALLETDEHGKWRPRFLFDPTPRKRDEFLPVCEWTQTSPDSRFTQHRICTLARPNGRALLMDNTLTITESGRTQEQQITEGDYPVCLQEVFGLLLG